MTVDTKKPALKVKEIKVEQPVNNGTTRPKNPSANILPTEGYVLEIDGKFKSKYETSEQAMKAALELKKKYSQVQVKIYDAKARTRIVVESPV